MISDSNNKKLHFIIGIGRSGTTILSKLLNEYHDVHCVPEAIFLIFFLKKFRDKKFYSPNDINHIFTQIDLYSHTHPWVGWKFDICEVKKNVIYIVEKNKKITYKELMIIIYQHFVVEGIDKTEAKIILDKNPSHTIFMDNISDFSPESKFIWIIRDYRATILSSKQSVFIRPSNIAYNATRWKLYNKIAYNFYKKNKNKVIIVKYEDLVTKENEIDRILNFLSIEPIKDIIIPPIEIDLANFKMNDPHKERFLKKYNDLNKILNTGRLFSWKDQLTAKEIEVCDVICSSIGYKIGYDSITNISLFKKLRILTLNIVPIFIGYFDIFKDKLLYYISPSIKIKRLRKKYIELGFIKK
ncbi:MAG: sulfotransferase [Ferruginibacter sp.]